MYALSAGTLVRGSAGSAGRRTSPRRPTSARSTSGARGPLNSFSSSLSLGLADACMRARARARARARVCVVRLAAAATCPAANSSRLGARSRPRRATSKIIRSCAPASGFIRGPGGVHPRVRVLHGVFSRRTSDVSVLACFFCRVDFVSSLRPHPPRPSLITLIGSFLPALTSDTVMGQP